MSRMTAPLWLLLYIAAVVWAIVESSKRWLTAMWIVLTLAAVIGASYVCSLIWPFGEEIFGHLVLPVSEVISGAVGVEHMRKHRRRAKDPGQ